jgi:putative transposase
VKYAWIAEQGKSFPLTEMCDVLNVSISGYQAWKRGGRPDRKRLTDAQMLALIRAIHAEIRGAYGSPRMVRELRSRGFPASKGRVERLMRGPPQATLQGHDRFEARATGRRQSAQ